MRLETVAGAAALLIFGSMLPAGAQALSSDQWNGFYAGVNGGGVSLNASGPLNLGCLAAVGGCGLSANGASALHNSSQSFKPTGLIGGAQAGYNWQVLPKWTVGVETDFNGSRLGH
jgi:outer membrane immunogenic protein